MSCRSTLWRAIGAGRGGAGRGGPGQGRAGQGRAGQGRAGQGRAGQGRAGQGRAGQGRAGHVPKLVQRRGCLRVLCIPTEVIVNQAFTFC